MITTNVLLNVDKGNKMSQNHKELLNKIKISLTFPEDTPIVINIDTSFSNEDLSNGIATVVLLEAYDLAILALQNSRKSVENEIKRMK